MHDYQPDTERTDRHPMSSEPYCRRCGETRKNCEQANAAEWEALETKVREWLLDYAWSGTADEQRREVDCIMSQDGWKYIDASAERFRAMANDDEQAKEAIGYALSALYECHSGPHQVTCKLHPIGKLIAAKKPLAEKRNLFLAAIGGLISAELWQEAYDAVVLVGPELGRSKRWHDACAWFVDQNNGGRPLDWTVIQGSVWLGHANA